MIFRQIEWMLIGRRLRSADVGVPGKHNDPRASPVAIKIQRHLGIPAHEIQAFGMRQVIDQKIGCSLIPPESGRCGLRHPAHIHCGKPHEILFMHATPYTFPKGRAVVWKLKGHSLRSFPSLFIALLRGGARANVSLGAIPTSLLAKLPTSARREQVK